MRIFVQFLLGGTVAAGLLGTLACLNVPAVAGFADSPGAKPTDYEQTLPGSEVKLTMVGIPGGSFEMGSPESEKGRLPNEGPVHPVTIRPFWMGKTEVTWDEYDRYWKTE